MTDEELKDAIDGLMAYDQGCTDSGIHDELLKERVKKELRSREDTTKFLTKYAVELMTCGQGYTIEDVKCLIEWLEKEMDYYV